LKTLCNNQVLVKNSDQLARYQNEIINRKSSCNNAISQSNVQIGQMNVAYIDMLDTFAKRYETFYNSTTMDPGSLAMCSKAICVSNMSLPAPSLPAKGTISNYQGLTLIEGQSIDQGLCNSSPEAAQVDQVVKIAVEQIRDYVLAMLLLGLGTIIALKGLIWGLKRWYYMELTTGYILEMELTSKMMKDRLKSLRIQAIIIWIVSVLIFVLNITVFSSFSRRNLE
jgi:hypothetical protein